MNIFVIQTVEQNMKVAIFAILSNRYVAFMTVSKCGIQTLNLYVM